MMLAVASAQERASANLHPEDVDVVRDNYVMKSQAFSPVARQQALVLVEQLRASASSMTKTELHLRLLEITGLADNGHDVVSFNSDAARPDLRMPFRVAWFPDALVIVRAQGSSSDLAGGRIEAIEGLVPQEVYDRLARYAGGIESRRKVTLSPLLESPQLLYTAGLAKRPDRLTLRVRLPSGHVVERAVQAIRGRDVPRSFGAERLLAPDPMPAESGWMPAVRAESAPLAFHQGNEFFRVEPLLDGEVLYVQFRANSNVAGQDIDAFQRRAVSLIQLHQPVDIVLDLRFDAGSDLPKTLEFMQALPAHVAGRVYVLISRYTFSAGMLSAAVVKKSASDRVVLVGELPGDRLRFWSEGGNACLPHAGFCLHYSTGLFDLQKGCTGEAGCYGDQFDVNVGDLNPDIEAPFTADDYLAGRDRALDLVLSRLR